VWIFPVVCCEDIETAGTTLNPLSRFRMGGLVTELQKKAIGTETAVSDLLRLALVVAVKLKLPEFESWINHELQGYERVDDIPSYRMMRGTVVSQNPYQGWIPLLFQDPEQEKVLSQRSLGQSIAALEDLIGDKGADGSFGIPFPPGSFRADFIRRHGPMVLQIQRADIRAIIDGVRTSILNWALRLEKDEIVGEEMAFSSEEVDRVAASPVTYNIENFQGNIGNVLDSTFQIGDSTILSEIDELDVSKAEKDEIREILEKLPDAAGEERKSLVTRGLSWVANHWEKIGDQALRISEHVSRLYGA